MLIEILIYLTTGAFVGFIAGLLGIGGGLIIVPVLTSVFIYFLQTEHVVHLAIGTSLATILITSYSAVKTHHKLGHVNWELVRLLGIGIFLGAFLGGWSSQFIDNNVLSKLFGFFELVIAIYMLLNIKPTPQRQLPSAIHQTSAGFGIGGIASILGIGGGTLTTPYLVWHNVKMHKAIATSTACSIPVAAAGTFGFLLGGLNTELLPEYATGYIYWPAFFGIVIMSYFTAPIGAKLTHQLPVKLLKKLFSFLLILLAIKMFFL